MLYLISEYDYLDVIIDRGTLTVEDLTGQVAARVLKDLQNRVDVKITTRFLFN